MRYKKRLERILPEVTKIFAKVVSLRLQVEVVVLIGFSPVVLGVGVYFVKMLGHVFRVCSLSAEVQILSSQLLECLSFPFLGCLCDQNLCQISHSGLACPHIS